jgi:hypothetical protein
VLFVLFQASYAMFITSLRHKTEGAALKWVPHIKSTGHVRSTDHVTAHHLSARDCEKLARLRLLDNVPCLEDQIGRCVI